MADTTLFGEPVPAVVIVHVADHELVADAVAARAEAEASETNASDARWREADIYADLAGRGWSARRIAAECGTNKSSVAYFLKAVSTYVDSQHRPTFWTAYNEARTPASTVAPDISGAQDHAPDEATDPAEPTVPTEDQLAILATMMARGVMAIDKLCNRSPSPIQTRDHVRDLTLIFGIAAGYSSDPAGTINSDELQALFGQVWPDVIECEHWPQAALWIGVTAMSGDPSPIGVSRPFADQLVERARGAGTPEQPASISDLADAAWSWLNGEEVA